MNVNIPNSEEFLDTFKKYAETKDKKLRNKLLILLYSSNIPTSIYNKLESKFSFHKEFMKVFGSQDLFQTIVENLINSIDNFDVKKLSHINDDSLLLKKFLSFLYLNTFQRVSTKITNSLITNKYYSENKLPLFKFKKEIGYYPNLKKLNIFLEKYDKNKQCAFINFFNLNKYFPDKECEKVQIIEKTEIEDMIKELKKINVKEYLEDEFFKNSISLDELTTSYEKNSVDFIEQSIFIENIFEILKSNDLKDEKVLFCIFYRLLKDDVFLFDFIPHFQTKICQNEKIKYQVKKAVSFLKYYLEEEK